MYVNKEIDVDIDIEYDDFDVSDIRELVTDWCDYGGHLDLIKSIVERNVKLDDTKNTLDLEFLYFRNKLYAKEIFEKNPDYLKLIEFIKENY